MQTHFTPAQLDDPKTRDAEKILRTCVHCGFCNSTCPTYLLLGDELDSPRGRIYLIKDMLENDRPATAEVARHVDRCLSCLSCQTTCPSGVHYQHLIDHARAHVEETFQRPLLDRTLRDVLARLLPYPRRFRLALQAASLLRFARNLLPPGRIAAMFALAPPRVPQPGFDELREVFPAIARRRARVALLQGCAQRVIAPSINESTIRLLNRHGVEVVIPKDGWSERSGCCGAIVHHLGKESDARALAMAAMRLWRREIDGEGLDAIVINASGCGTEVKDYGHMFRDDPEWAGTAALVSALARDVSEYAAEIGIAAPTVETGLAVAYHSACSLQHGQRIQNQPKALLAAAGFDVRDVAEGHICCGSAGTYNLLQPELAMRLRDRKLANIDKLAPDVVATGNVGCIAQLASGSAIPVVHTVELLDWATGGPMPGALAARGMAGR